MKKEKNSLFIPSKGNKYKKTPSKKKSDKSFLEGLGLSRDLKLSEEEFNFLTFENGYYGGEEDEW